jgi:hypothetical protein
MNAVAVASISGGVSACSSLFWVTGALLCSLQRLGLLVGRLCVVHDGGQVVLAVKNYAPYKMLSLGQMSSFLCCKLQVASKNPVCCS